MRSKLINLLNLGSSINYTQYICSTNYWVPTSHSTPLRSQCIRLPPRDTVFEVVHAALLCFALLWLRLPCCLISVPFALAMPTLAGASTSTSSGSMKYSRHAACGKRHAALPQLTTHYNCPKTRSGNEVGDVGEVGVAIGSSCCS